MRRILCQLLPATTSDDVPRGSLLPQTAEGRRRAGTYLSPMEDVKKAERGRRAGHLGDALGNDRPAPTGCSLCSRSESPCVASPQAHMPRILHIRHVISPYPLFSRPAGGFTGKTVSDVCDETAHAVALRREMSYPRPTERLSTTY